MSLCSALPFALLTAEVGGHAGEAGPAPQVGWVVGNTGAGSKWEFWLLSL